jgi:hypothetical protein
MPSTLGALQHRLVVMHQAERVLEAQHLEDIFATT